jgi:hypothetical protein
MLQLKKNVQLSVAYGGFMGAKFTSIPEST